MASKYSVILLPIFISLFTYSLSVPISRNTICSSSVNPSFCQSILPDNPLWDVYDFSHFSFLKSLSTTKNISSLISKYLKTQSVSPLKDCKELAESNINFLSRTIKSLNSTKSSVGNVRAEDMQALFSAILTNQQTCLDGLQSSSSSWIATNDIHTSLSDGSKMYSLSLALFTRAWGHETKSRKQQKYAIKLVLSKGGSDRKNVREYLKRVHVKDFVTVNSNGSADFATIGDAVSAAPNNTDVSEGYFVIYVMTGVYQEYVNITANKTNLLMIGDGINKTVITGNRSVADGWSTFNSATFVVVGQGFVGVNITIQNTAGAIKHQAVALRSGADMSTFYRCSFEGYQDTLYPHSMRQFYRECDIYGTVDFIFGNAAVVFQNCNMYPTLPMRGQGNEVTAQGRTDPNQSTGTSIQNCTIRASQALASANFTVKTHLGRPWKEYSRTVFMQTFMDSLIDPSGWDLWSGDFALSTLYYAEYNNTGPGSDTANRVTWPGYHVIQAQDAVNFTVSNFLAGDVWLPRTGVPFSGGLF